MVRVLLIVAAAACSGSPAPRTQGPTTPAFQESLWDSGTFVVIDKEKLDPDAEETFTIHQTGPSSYRLTIDWKRRAPTGEPADGTVKATLDARFVATSGDDVMNFRAATNEVTRSRFMREPDGRMTTEQIAADGTKSAVTSAQPNDWFLSSKFTSFLIVMCQADAALASPLVYPDKQTQLEPPKALPIPEQPEREVTFRRLTYAQSQRQVIAACEHGKVAGEVTRGVTIVRRGDEALARTLERWFR